MDFLSVTYELATPLQSAPALAESILLEQTIETPAVVGDRYPFVKTNMLGEILSLEQVDKHTTRLKLALPTQTARVDPAQFLNVLFGNVSLHEKVQLVDFELPQVLRPVFSGPQFGIHGMRDKLGVARRPLTCAALKPVGIDLDEMTRILGIFARSGIDMIKDDHYLADHPFCRFEERVTRCLQTVEKATQETGRNVWYVPNLSGTYEQVVQQAAFAQKAGAPAVMVAPMLLGLPQFQELVRHYLHVPVLAHPSFAGSLRMTPSALLGKLFRLFGADAVIFANYGGRFSYPKDICLDLAETMRAPWLDFNPSLPTPAGGMTVERAQELVEAFGQDTMLLIGGSLLQAEDLASRTRSLVNSVLDASTT